MDMTSVREDRGLRIGAGPWAPKGAAAALARTCLGLFALLMVLVGEVRAAEDVDVDVRLEESYGRVILTFAGRNIMPPYKLNADNGVLVIEFQDEVDMRVDRIPSLLSRFVTIARVDPEKKGARFALTRSTTINTMEAGPKLFIDFLPSNWTGPPPRLPPEVIAELARRAEEAARAARDAELLKSAGTKTPKLDLRVARTPTFSRFSFRWNVPYEADFQRRDGGISVAFNRSSKVDLSAIKADMPAFVEDIATETSEDGMEVILSIAASADVRAFREDDVYVIDVQGGAEPGNLAPESTVIRSAARINDPLPSTARDVVVAPGIDVMPATPPNDSTLATPRAPASVGTPPVSVLAPATPAAPQLPGGGAPSMLALPQPGGPAATPAPDGTGPGVAGDYALAPQAPAPPAGPTINAELADGMADHKLADGVIRVEAKRVGGSTRILFPYPREIGAAMFSRGPALWLVFDDPSQIDPVPLQDALAGFARKIEPMKVGNSQAIRIELVDALLSTLSPDGTRWIVTVGDMVMEPTRPLPLQRAVRDDTKVVLEVPFGPVNQIHEIADPTVGDRIFVVTGTGQPRGLIKPQVFAEVDGLSSAHGLAFVPKVDDLQIKAGGELVTILRPDGLKLSPDTPVKQSSYLQIPSSLSNALGGRPGHLDFTGLIAEDPKAFWKKRHQLAAEVSQARDREERVDAWYRMSTFLIANGLGPEAMGVLNLIDDIAPDETATPQMMIRRAAASFLMYRPEDALAALAADDFADSPDAAVWRTIVLTDLGNHMEARRNLSRAEPLIGAFPPIVQKRFLMAGVETAIELNDYGKARGLLSQIDPKTLTGDEKAKLDLLNARAVDAAGHASEAADLLSNVIRKHEGPQGAEATYRLVRLQRREGLITLDQAIDRLEQLAVSWRGDAIELKTLRTLGQYVIEKGDYRRAFEVMRTAELIDPKSDVTRLMQDEMQAAFASLYLDGKADEMKPIDALALYYDFREMTPNGRRGDAMVRKLAERLIEVDLLPQAAQLLNYQIENRLHGAARAQVAADLALVYLLDRRPERALLTLSRTRQAELPVAIERQRRVVEARALADTGKHDLGLDLLTPLKGSDVDRLRAEILWSSDRYAEAGEQFERLLGGRWHDNLPLSDYEQMDVLKSAISYSLGNERLGMDRLRAKFSKKMAETPSGAAFDVVTGPIVARGNSFDQVVASLASIDTMTAFLDDYRQRYLEFGGGQKPELVGAQADPLDAVAPPASPG